MPEVHHLFPSPVIAEIADDLDTEQLKNDKFAFETIQHRGYNNISEIGKDIRILERYPTLEKQLLKKWKDAAYHIFNYRNDFKITTSWITRSKKGSQSTIHLHKNSFFSGLLYYGKYIMYLIIALEKHIIHTHLHHMYSYLLMLSICI